MVIIQSGTDEQLTDEGIGYVPTGIELSTSSPKALSGFPVRVETTKMVKEHFFETQIPKCKQIWKEKTQNSSGR